MNKKIIIVVLVGVALAAIIALMWWWFFNRPNNAPQPTGTFGTAQNRPSSASGTSTATNIGTPTLGNSSANGAYILKTLDGQSVGSYLVSTNPDGTYSFAPANGSNPLNAGSYTITLNGVTLGNFVLAPVGSSFSLTPYTTTGSTSTTGGGYWLSTPSIDSSGTASTNTGGTSGAGGGTSSNGGTSGNGGGTNGTSGSGSASLGIGGGLSFTTATNTIFSNTNLFNSGTMPNIGSSGNANGKGLGLEGALIGAVATGVAACVLPALAKTIAGSFSLAVTGRSMTAAGTGISAAAAVKGEAAGATAVGGVVSGVPVSGVVPGAIGEAAASGATSGSGGAMSTAGGAVAGFGTDIATNLGLSIDLSNLITNDVLNCFARTVAHAALEQIARSTVAWINSGFKGSPSFVTNYTQFFTNVADSAAGQFLQSSQLSFLCSPFSLQIKIAVAQSYARTNSGQQCTLTKTIKNINNFMNGNFAAGGWPGFISFTTQPTNNPYGAFAAGSIGIHSAAANAAGQKQFDLGLSGGFLSITQNQNCTLTQTPPAPSSAKSVTQADGPTQSGQPLYSVCDVKNVTPGTAIAQSLNQTLGINTQSLEMAKYFDEIITALVGQLMQNIQSHGLANMSSGSSDSSGYYGGYVTTSNASTGSMVQQSVLQNIAPLMQSAQNLIAYTNENIGNINTTITTASALQNCWLSLATTATSSADQTKAQQNAAAITPILTDLNNRLTIYQGTLTQANSSIASVQSAQAQAQSTTDTATLENILNSVVKNTQNQAFVQDTNVVNAQEDQINLSTALDGYNQNIATQQQACASSTTSFPAPLMTPTPVTMGG